MPLTKTQRSKIIDNLIENVGVGDDGVWGEEDREGLETLSDSKLMAMNSQREQLAKFIQNADKKVMDDDEDEEEEEVAANKGSCGCPTKNEEKPKTAEQWMAEAPPEIRNAVQNWTNFEKSQKEELIKKITKNERNPFDKKYLQSRSLEELKGLAVLATNESQDQQDQQMNVLAPHYAGVPGIVRNLGEDFSREDLDMAPEPFEWN